MRTLTGQEGGESTSINISNNQSEMRLPLRGLRNDEFATDDSMLTETEQTTPIISRSWAVAAERDNTNKDHTVDEKDVIFEKEE